jgi:hypothetical protein
MKYTAKVKADQTIQIAGDVVIVIKPEGGEMPDAQARAIAETLWGKRLIETGLLAFESDAKVETAPLSGQEKKKPPRKTRDLVKNPDFGGGGESA